MSPPIFNAPFKTSIDVAIAQQAAEWFASLRADDVDETLRARWQSWLQARPEHAQAWQRVEAIGRQFEALPAAPARQVLSRAGLARRRAMKAFALAGVGSGLIWAGLRTAAWQSGSTDLRTALGETREFTLADGTRVWLNTASAVDVHYDEQWRRVVLQEGEVLIDTAQDDRTAPRPWVLDTPQGRLRALGTRFSVRLGDGVTDLAVFEGAVEIRAASSPTLVLPAGQQLRFTEAGPGAPAPAQWQRQSWAAGMLVADDMRLADFLEELSRYRRGHLGCDPAVADLRLVGAYPLAEPERILAALETTLPVSVHQPLPWWTVVRPR